MNRKPKQYKVLEAIAGITAALIVAALVKAKPVDILRWLALAVVLYTAVMLRAALAGQRGEKTAGVWTGAIPS